jgi:hypothetical protein
MSKVQITHQEKAEQFPINVRADGYSFRYGANNMTFSLGAVNDRLVDVNSLRLNFTLQIIDTDGGDTYVNNQNTYGTGARACLIDDRTGVNGVIHTLRVASGETNNNLSEIRNYNRLLCASLPANKSFFDYKGDVSVKDLAFARSDTEGLAVNGDMACSIPLRAGIFQDKPLNLADFGGLVIDIALAPDNLFLYGANAGDCFYRLQDVSLTWNWLVLSSPMPPSNEQLQYPLYRNFLNILQSSDSTTTLNMALKSVRSVFSTFIRSANVNNFTTNSFTTEKIRNAADADQDILEYSHRRANVRYNNKFNISERVAVGNGVYPSLLGRNGLNALQPFRNIVSCLQSPEIMGAKTGDASNSDKPDERPLYLLSVNFDQMFLGFGADFDRATYGVRIQNQLTTAEANSIYTYALANAGLAVGKQGGVVNEMN